MLEVDMVEVDEVVSSLVTSLVSVSLELLLGAAWLGAAAVVVGRVGWSAVVGGRCWGQRRMPVYRPKRVGAVLPKRWLVNIRWAGRSF